MKTKMYTKNLIALMMIGLMLAGMMILPVSAADLPETGIILFDDFESYELGQLIGRYADGNGPFTRRVAYPAEVNGTKAWNTNPPENVGATANHLGYFTYSTDYGQVEINSGKLVYEYDIYYPTPQGEPVMSSTQKVGHYLNTYGKSWDGSEPDKVRAYLAYSQMKYDTSAQDYVAQIWFPVQAVGGPSTIPLDNAVTLEKDKWHRIAHYIDFSKGEVHHYINGKLAASYEGSADDARRDYPMYEWLMYTNNTTSTTDARFTCYIDNVKIERLSDNSPINAKVISVDENYIEVSFSGIADLSILTASDFELQLFSGESLGVPTSMTTSANRVRLGYSNLEAGKTYNLFVKKEIKGSINSNNVLPAGYRIDFTIPANLISKTILNQNFENVTFGKNNSWADVKVSYSADANAADNYVDMSQWGFQTAADESVYLKETTLNDSKAAVISPAFPAKASDGSASLVLPFESAVGAGKLDVEFDVDFTFSTDCGAVGIGLRDTTNTVTAYNPWESWGDATYIAGLGYSGKNSIDKKVLYTNLEDTPNRIPTYYTYRTPNYDSITDAHSPNGNAPSARGAFAEDAIITKDFYVDTNRDTNDKTSQKWKFIVDITNGSYEFYINGALKKEQSIPGDAGIYDALVITPVAFPTSEPLENEIFEVTVDNVKASSITQPLLFCGMEYQDEAGNNTEVKAHSVLDTTQKIVLKFSQPLNDSSLSKIRITSEDDIDYTVTKDGANAIISFSKALAYNKTYNLAIDSDVADASGAKLGTIVNVNISVVPKEPFIATGIKYQKFNDTSAQEPNSISTSTNRIFLHFTNPINAAALSYISVSGDASYEIEKVNNNAIITLSKPLTPKTNYKITIAKDFCDEKGLTLGEDIIYNFTTDEGELLLENPVLKLQNTTLYSTRDIAAGQTLTASTNAINTTGSPQTAVLLVAAYKNDLLSFTAVSPIHTVTQNFSNNSISFDFTATADFVGADYVKVFLLNNLTDIKPLTASTVIDSRAGIAAYLIRINDDSNSVRILDATGNVNNLTYADDLSIDGYQTGQETITKLNNIVGHIMLYKLNDEGEISYIDSTSTSDKESGTTLTYRGYISGYNNVSDRYNNKNFGGRFLCSDDTILLVANHNPDLRDAYYRRISFDDLTDNTVYESYFYKTTNSSYIDIVVIKEISEFSMPIDTRFVMVSNVRTETKDGKTVTYVDGYTGTTVNTYEMLSTLPAQYIPKKGDFVCFGLTPYGEVAAVECHYDAATNGENTWATPNAPFYSYTNRTGGLKSYWQKLQDKLYVARAILGHVVALDGTALSWGYNETEDGINTIAEVADIANVPIIVYDLKTDSFYIGDSSDIISSIKNSSNYSDLVGEMSYGNFKAIYIINNRNAQ